MRNSTCAKYLWSILLASGAAAGLAAEPASAAECRVDNFGTLAVDMQGLRPTTVIKVNGQDARFILDTGAFFNTMSRANADALGLKLDAAPPGMRGVGIGGSFALEVARIKEFGILGGTLHNVEFIVGGSDAGTGLIGSNLLNAVDLDADLAHGKMRLLRPQGCGKVAMAYWTKDGNFQVADIRPSDGRLSRSTVVDVTINGKSVRAVLDTGAPTTVLTRPAAERAGIKLDGPQAKPGGMTSGFGTKAYQSWIVPVDTFTIGTETIQHTQMQVMDGTIGGSDGPDMLLGADFFLAHHIFIANSQHKIYFTYNGGRIFALGKPPKQSALDQIATAGEDGPKTAEDFALRGQALLARGEPAAALADLDRAITMGPDRAGWHLARARVHRELKQDDAALGDLDKAIASDPADIDARLMRAGLRLAHTDRKGSDEDIAAARDRVPAGSDKSRAVASFLIELEQPAAALPLLDRWVDLHRNDADLGSGLNARCWARTLANQLLDEALADCRTAIKRDGAKASYLDSMGLTLLRLKQYPAAISAYEKVLAEVPGLAWSRYGLGLARERSGQAEAGRSDLKAAMDSNPEIAGLFQRYGI
ncbi:aspartyl protease family protein [Novosphingobium flavum]|uniref:Aspartyl protease family protein n=1 Tax=Novosphingobium flavum TaxID=1778672 RepID=A0A7X1KLT3_9SPHN|nr:aspartyl protease family protein [Novosphingobium flavum]MBC2665924.1 aspartyl protease family protein [Novosphingobium flavum]